MGRPYRISLRKNCPYESQSAEEITNIYHYRTPQAQPDQVPTQELIDAIWDREQNMMSTEVFAEAGYVTGPTDGTQAEDIFQAEYSIQESGTAVDAPSIHPSICLYFAWPLGRYGVRNQPQYLKKWIRLLSKHSFTDPQIGGRETLAANLTGGMAAYRNEMPVITTPDGTEWQLCTAQGRIVQGTGIIDEYIETHDVSY